MENTLFLDEALRLMRQLQAQGKSRAEAQKEVAARITDALDPNMQEQLHKLMGDKAAVDKLMGSWQAKELMRRMGEKD
ncbi:MAG: hypothetical protein LBN05_00880 [Oscillospiraceae bacterium]|jgi:hypothetical protein|nr:hypothetical protein [Oscillospiraceae bacterium]